MPAATYTTVTVATVVILLLLLEHLHLDVATRTTSRSGVACPLVMVKDIRIAYSMCLKLNRLMLAHYLFDIVHA